MHQGFNFMSASVL